ncbi:hypothetical protein BGZ83_011983 [Gryganskiella cystojenkinii]|nr:hypothetical protein BGZ83_011983 [Gryganskiella cystojenkinii]
MKTHWCSRLVMALRLTPNLLELEASWMIADLLEAAVHLKKLERLSIPRLQGSHSEDNCYFRPSFQGSKNLRYLNMTDTHLMTDEALFQINKACPNIQVLAVSGNTSLTHDGLIQWCDALDSAAESTSSSLSNEEKEFKPIVVTAGTLSTSAAFTTFTTLNSVKSIQGWTELTTIDFTNCNRIQSEGFEALFQHSRHLQDVNLMSTRVQDKALFYLADQNPNLRSVVLNCCAHMSDVGLRKLLTTCVALESVSFLYCHRVSVSVFFHQLWKCLNLKELNFSLSTLHKVLIEFGLGTHGNNINGNNNSSSSSSNTMGLAAVINNMESLITESILPTASEFFEPHLELQIFGEPDLETMDGLPPYAVSESSSAPSMTTSPTTQAHSSGPPSPGVSSVQEYRQQLILEQLYRQIERLSSLEALCMRDLHLPLTLARGLWRLGRLDRLKSLEWSGLEVPLGAPEVEWLAGGPAGQSVFKGGEGRNSGQTQEIIDEDVTTLPLRSLKQLVIKGGYGMSTAQALVIQEQRPQLDIRLIHIRSSGDSSASHSNDDM